MRRQIKEVKKPIEIAQSLEQFILMIFFPFTPRDLSHLKECNFYKHLSYMNLSQLHYFDIKSIIEKYNPLKSEKNDLQK